MNNVKNQLTEVLINSFEDQYKKRGLLTAQHTAEDLIAGGVTMQRWIPVSEELPKTIPCSAGTEYSEAVNVLTSGRKVITAIWNGTEFIGDANFWDAVDEEITHWTPVLMPLPDLSEEEQQ